MTKKEKEVLDLSAELWNKFLQLDEIHPDDVPEFRFHIHALQNIVFAREGLRSEHFCLIKQPAK